MDGFLNLLKPPGMTSSDAVVFVRRHFPKGTKTGHGGTLDPDAAGVLPVCVGKATRLFDYIIDKDKEYIAELRLGIETDTQDATGAIIARGESIFDEAAVRNVLPRFTGEIAQRPPMYSALKRDGEKLYDIARKGKTVDIEKRNVTVHGIEYLSQTAPDRHLLRVSCGKGVYIRTLLRDIAETLGTCGHMAFLLRSKAGVFSVQDAVTVEELDAAAEPEKLLLPLDLPLGHLPRADFGESAMHAITNGNPLPVTAMLGECALREGDVTRIYVCDRFAGMAALENGLLRFKAMLL